MRQLHCPECDSIDATLSGRCKKCGREMVPLVGKVEPLAHKPPTDVIPIGQVLDEFHKRCGIPAEYLKPETTKERLLRTGR